MSEAASIWFFLAIAVICYTWHKIATAPRRVEKPTPEPEISLVLNGKPFNGSMNVTSEGTTRTYKIVEGKIS